MPVVIQWVQRWLPQTETWLYNQVRHLPASVESHIVCESTSNLDQFSLPRLHSLEGEPPWRQAWDRQLRKLRLRRHFGFLVREARRARAGILHSHFGNMGWQNLGAARAARLRHVVTFYGYDVGQLPREDARWRERYREMFAAVDRVLCEGPHMAESIAALGCPRDKLRVHHLGVSMEELPFQPRQWRPGKPLRVLLIAAFREKKGIPFALEALGRLQHELPLEITVIGDASKLESSQVEKRRILEVIERHGLQPRVRLLGYRPWSVCFEEAARHHLFLSPSVHAADGDCEGGAPLGLIEMAATGLPVVSTTHCDIVSVLQHGVTGWLAPERDVDALVAGLKWWTEAPGEWAGRLAAARRHLEREYDARTQGGRLAAIYEELAERAR